MQAMSLARKGYAARTAPTITARRLEFDALARVTHRLDQAASRTDAGHFAELAAALLDNRRLWTLFAIDVARPENQLTAELKAQIFYLSEFTTQHSSAVLQRTADVAPLIEINTAIMRGLREGGS